MVMAENRPSEGRCLFTKSSESSATAMNTVQKSTKEPAPEELLVGIPRYL